MSRLSTEKIANDEIQLAKAKQQAFDIVKRSRSGGSSSNKSGDVGKQQQKTVGGSGSSSSSMLSSLKKNLFSRGSSKSEQPAEANVTHATADITTSNEASVLLCE